MIKKSLLWKISGNQIQNASYLFGTIHLLCANEFEIKQKVRTAFNKCKVLYMEMDLSENIEDQTSEENKKISDDLQENERAELESILHNEYHISLNEVDHQATIFLINKMIMSTIECDEIMVYEMELLKMAQEKDMPVLGLETLHEQMGIAANIYTSRELLNQLRLKETYKELFTRLMQAYKEEDLNSLLSLITDKKLMTAQVEQLMVSGRNENWARQMEAILPQQPSFFAVGAGHLPGPNGLIELLRKKGFTVNAVYR